MTHPIDQTRQSRDMVRADAVPAIATVPARAAPSAGPPVRSDTAVALAERELARSADLLGLAFSTTADIEPIEELVGQERAAGAIRFGTQIERPGFNLFVIGPSGAAMQDAVKTILKHQAAAEPSPKDWVYVNNFADSDKPIAIELPTGRVPKLRDAVQDLIDDFKTALPAVFQSEDYQTRRSAIDEEFHKKQGEGTRPHPQMKRLARNLTDREISALVGYFSVLAPP